MWKSNKARKEAATCDFCALKCCKSCLAKQRQFPQVITEGKSLKGNICRICDRKFYIRSMLGQKHAEISENYQMLAGENGMA